MRATLISLFSVILLSASAKAQQADTVPPPPGRTTMKKAADPQTPNGDEMCTIEIKGQKPVEVAPTCEGLQSKQTDLDVCLDIAEDVCGVSRDVVKEAVKKRDPNIVREKKTPKKKRPAKKPAKKKTVKKKVVKKPSPPPTLRRFNKEPKGTNCSEGGVSIHDGSDKNRNGKLEQGEVKTSYYVCNGRDGADGKDGKNGLNGQDGNNGRDGTDGEDGEDGSRVNIGFGVTASAIFADGHPNAYAIGPSLQLQISLSPKWELTAEGAWAIGKDRATMLNVGVSRYLKPWLFVGSGVFAEWIGQSGNYAKAQFVGLTPGVGVRFNKGNHSLRASANLFVGFEGFNLDDDRTGAVGPQGSVLYTHTW